MPGGDNNKNGESLAASILVLTTNNPSTISRLAIALDKHVEHVRSVVAQLVADYELVECGEEPGGTRAHYRPAKLYVRAPQPPAFDDTALNAAIGPLMPIIDPFRPVSQERRRFIGRRVG